MELKPDRMLAGVAGDIVTPRPGSTVIRAADPETYLRRLANRLPVAWAVALGMVVLLALVLGVSDTTLINAAANDAVQRAMLHDGISARFGDSLVVGQASGRIVTGRHAARLELMVPVRGTRARGKVHATALVEDGATKLTSVTVTMGKERIIIPVGEAAFERGKR